MAREKKSADRLDQSPIHLLHRASQRASDVFQEEIPGDLTPRQFAILLTVAQNEGLSQTHLVEQARTSSRLLTDACACPCAKCAPHLSQLGNPTLLPRETAI